MLIDTHCHLADPATTPTAPRCSRGPGRPASAAIVVIGESPRVGRARAARSPRTSRGSPPPPASIRTTRRLDRRGRRLAARQRLRRPEVVAVGEMGLDYHYDHSPRGAQRQRVRGPARSGARGRQAGGDPRPRGGRRRRRGAPEPSRTSPPSCTRSAAGPGSCGRGLDLGHYVSFSGMITFKNWRLDEAIRGDAARPAAGRDRRALPRAGPASRQAERAGVRAGTWPSGSRRSVGSPAEDLIARRPPPMPRASFGCRNPPSCGSIRS